MMNIFSSSSPEKSSTPVCNPEDNRNLSSEDNKISAFADSFFKTSFITAGISAAFAAVGGCTVFLSIALFLFRSVTPIESHLFYANTLGAVSTGTAFAKHKNALGLVLATATAVGSFVACHLAGEQDIILHLALAAISLVSYGVVSISGNKPLPIKILVGHLLGIGGFFVTTWIVSQVGFGALAYCTITVAVSIVANIAAVYVRKIDPDSRVAKIASSIAFMSAMLAMLGIAVGVSERASHIAFWKGKLPAESRVIFGPGFNYQKLISTFQAGSYPRVQELALAGVAATSAACAVHRERNVADVAKDFFGSFVGNAAFSSLLVMAFKGPFDLVPIISLLVSTGVVAARILRTEHPEQKKLALEGTEKA